MQQNKYLEPLQETSPGGVSRHAQLTEFDRLMSEREALIAELKALGFDSFLADPADIETCQADIQFFQDELARRKELQRQEVETGQPAIHIPSRLFPSRNRKTPKAPKREQSKVFDVDVDAAREYQIKAEKERKAAVSKMPIYEHVSGDSISEFITRKRKRGMIPLKFDEQGIPYIFAHETVLESAKRVFLGEK